MTTYSTGNPVGSPDPRDLYDNAENLDNAANSDSATWTDRLGQSRLTMAGIEQDATTAIQNAGYVGTGTDNAVEDYAAGIEITQYNQIVRDGGEFWRVSGSETLPYTLTGAGVPEGGALVSVGDAALRQDLVQPVATFNSVADMKSSAMLDIGRRARTLGYYEPGDGGGNDYEIVAAGTDTDDGGSFIDLAGSGLQAKGLFASSQVNVRQFGAKGDLSDDTAYFQSAFDYAGRIELTIPPGTYAISNVQVTRATAIKGVGPRASRLYPYSAGDTLVIEGNGDYVTIENVGFYHDRSFNANALVFKSLNNRWCHLDTVFFEGFKGAAIYSDRVILESVFSKLKIRTCGDLENGIASIDLNSVSGDLLNNITIRDLALYAFEGIGIRVKSEFDGSQVAPGSRMIRLTDSLIHGGNIETEYLYPVSGTHSVVIDNFTYAYVKGNRFTGVAPGFKALILESTGAYKSEGGVVDKNNFFGNESGWEGIRIDSSRSLTVGDNYYSTGCVKHLSIGSLAEFTSIGRQLVYGNEKPIITNSGFQTCGFVEQDKYTVSSVNSVIMGVLGLNGSRNIAGNVSFTNESSKVVTLPNEEPDSQYNVVLTANEDTNVWYSEKSTTQFTINASSSFTGGVSWVILR